MANHTYPDARIHAYWDRRSLQEIGVQPGWFCKHGSCSIWFQVLRVYDGMLVCIARDPAKGTELVLHGPNYTRVDWLCPSLPVGDVIVAEPRAKNFFDKFYREPSAMAAFATHPMNQEGPVHV